MPDLSEQLSALLQNPEAQKNISALLSSLGQSQPEPSGFSPAPDFSAFLKPSEPATPNMDISSLMKLQQVFSRMSCDDKNVSLLKALRPYLHEPQKADDAIRILQLLSVLPALKECGLFGGNHP